MMPRRLSYSEATEDQRRRPLLSHPLRRAEDRGESNDAKAGEPLPLPPEAVPGRSCWLSWGNGFSRGCIVRLWRSVFVFKVHCEKSADLSALVDQPTIMLRSVSHPSAGTKTTYGASKKIKKKISHKERMSTLSYPTT